MHTKAPWSPIRGCTHPRPSVPRRGYRLYTYYSTVPTTWPTGSITIHHNIHHPIHLWPTLLPCTHCTCRTTLGGASCSGLQTGTAWKDSSTSNDFDELGVFLAKFHIKSNFVDWFSSISSTDCFSVTTPPILTSVVGYVHPLYFTM